MCSQTLSKNFSAVRTAYGEKLKKMKQSSQAGAASTPATPAADPKLLARKARKPIFVIYIQVIEAHDNRPQPTHNYDLIFSYCSSHNAQREEVPGGFNVMKIFVPLH
jgi:hypothetical protein